MPDPRSRIEKLRAMAAQTASPQEAEIARRILEEIEEDEKIWGRESDPEEVFRRFSSQGSISRDAIEVFAAAFGFRVDFNQRERPVEAKWEGGSISDAPLAEMISVFRKGRGSLEGGKKKEISEGS